MVTEFNEWFNERYGKNQSHGRGVASEAWDEAMNRGAKYARAAATPQQQPTTGTAPVGCEHGVVVGVCSKCGAQPTSADA